MRTVEFAQEVSQGSHQAAGPQYNVAETRPAILRCSQWPPLILQSPNGERTGESQAHARGSSEGGPQRPTHNSSPRRRQRRFFFALRLFFFQRNHEVKQGAGAIPDKRRSSRGGARGLTMAALPKPSFRKRAFLVGVALVGGARRRRRRPRRLGFEPTATTVGPRSTPRGSERRRRRQHRQRRRRRRRRRRHNDDIEGDGATKTSKTTTPTLATATATPTATTTQLAMATAGATLTPTTATTTATAATATATTRRSRRKHRRGRRW